MTDARSAADRIGAAVPFGEVPERGPAVLFTLENSHIRVRITDYGGRIVSLEAPDARGRRESVVLGFESAKAYQAAGLPFGALLGRNANRIGGGCFTLDGKTYHLSKNENGSTLHGGAVGFDKVIWEVVDIDTTRLALRHVSPDGDQGFPGEVTVNATYRLDGDTLWLEFEARTTKPTPLSLSAHPYFNLAGAGPATSTATRLRYVRIISCRPTTGRSRSAKSAVWPEPRSISARPSRPAPISEPRTISC